MKNPMLLIFLLIFFSISTAAVSGQLATTISDASAPVQIPHHNSSSSSLVPAAAAAATPGLLISTSSNDFVPDQIRQDNTDSLLPDTPKQDTVLLAAPDGTIYLVETYSMKILWSFTSGTSIYSSYRALSSESDKYNTSRHGADFFIDCGDDWELYIHTKDFKKVKLQFDAEELIRRTPYISTDGVLLGTKNTTVFLVDAKSGTIIYTFSSLDLLPSEDQSSEENPLLAERKFDKSLLPTAVDLEAVDQLLYIKRTDYGLKFSSSRTGKVLWYLTFADIEASYQTKGFDGFLKGSSSNEFGLKPFVYRIRDHDLFESIFGPDRLLSYQRVGEMLPLPAENDHYLLQTDDKLQEVQSNNEAKEPLALPGPEVGESEDSDMNIDVPPQSQASFLSWAHFAFVALLLSVASICFIAKSGLILKKQSKNLEVQIVMSKKKKSRKSSGNKSIAISEKLKKNTGHENADNSINGLLPSERTDMRLRFTFNSADGLTDGRKIGKLIVSNKEIAKGSNGTIVLEGIYDGRPVAVKRLVQTHHDIALKEIKNLIASDQHPNIVRWFGVEYDQDFVYLSLERCSCSLHDLISSYSNSFQSQRNTRNPLTDINNQVQWTMDASENFELWKANGYPSTQLLKVMRDIVTGLAHLHELGIIHRDLKPQNVLIRKEKSLSAKVSDMGISKRLVGDMSSLTRQTTGNGSSGWQAPEQLLHERQTRAVDLFSLGCVLFFCLSGGRHPFGDNLERDINIVNNRKDLFLVEHIPEATDLISRLLGPKPDSRPKAAEVLQHPLFWTPETRLSFLRDASDRVELEDRETDSQLLKALESIGPVALGGKWDEKMESTFINDIGRYRRYKYDSVRDLLRVIRNKLNHYRELSKEIQGILGQVPEGFESYFSSRFPKLLIEVYKVLQRYCGEEEFLQKYFSNVQS